MVEIKKNRSHPLSARINEIPIKKTPKTISTKEMKKRNRESVNRCLHTHPEIKAASQLRNRQWHANEDNKVKRNVRQRLRRYKVKLDTQLSIIWTSRGLIHST